MFYLFFAQMPYLLAAAEEVSPVGTPIWVPITIIVILLLLFLWGLTRSAIPAETAVSAADDHHTDHDDTAENRSLETVALTEDLKRIEGIGPKIESVLHNAGIKTFAELAATSISTLEKIVRIDAGITIAFPGTWPEQAALARDGKWEALAVLQDELQGGRRE